MSESKAFFASCVKKWSHFPGAEDMRGVIVRALREAWGKPTYFSGIGMGLLARAPVIGPATRRAAAA